MPLPHLPLTLGTKYLVSSDCGRERGKGRERKEKEENKKYIDAPQGLVNNKTETAIQNSHV
jgi:hypothetical protein